MESVNAPASANITEFWQAPLFSVAELASAGVARVLYLLSAFRCVNKATESLLDNSARQSAAVVLDTMHTAYELDDRIGYHTYGLRLDAVHQRSDYGATADVELQTIAVSNNKIRAV